MFKHLYYFMVRTLSIDEKKFTLSDEIEKVLEGEVKKIGNGGMVLANKRYIGKKTYLIIRKN